jgi:hypothetical protein
MLAALPLANGARIKPRGSEEKAAPAAMIEKKAEDPIAPSGHVSPDVKDSINGKKKEKKEKPPDMYDPGTTGLCPKIVPHTNGGTVPSMVIVTIKNAQHLPWSYLDHPDAFVEFWTGKEGERQSYLGKKLLPGKKVESYWRARTQAYNDDTSPLWDWSCLLVYDVTNPTISFQVYDRDLASKSEFLGKATGNMLEIFEAEDQVGHGDFEVKFRLMNYKDEPLRDRDNNQATLTVNFEIIREKALYQVRRREGFADAHTSAYREVY